MTARDSRGGWYSARVLSVDGEFVTVHFDGWESRWDERLNASQDPPPLRPWSSSAAVGPMGRDETGGGGEEISTEALLDNALGSLPAAQRVGGVGSAGGIDRLVFLSVFFTF